MFHYAETCVTSKGDALPGWQVEVVLVDTTTVQPIFSDENSTPIITVSGITNRALVDSDGNFDLFVAAGNYSVRYYDDNGVYQRTVRYLNMYGVGDGSVGGGNTEATTSEMWTGTSTTTRVSPKKVFDMAAPVSVTDGATVTLDLNAGLNFEWAIGGNRTLANPTNGKSGQSGTIKITQDATGGRIITYGSNWRFPGGATAAGSLTTLANAIDILAYTLGSDGKYYATLSRAFSA